MYIIVRKSDKLILENPATDFKKNIEDGYSLLVALLPKSLRVIVPMKFISIYSEDSSCEKLQVIYKKKSIYMYPITKTDLEQVTYCNADTFYKIMNKLDTTLTFVHKWKKEIDEEEIDEEESSYQFTDLPMW